MNSYNALCLVLFAVYYLIVQEQEFKPFALTMRIENLSPKPDKDGFPPGININFILPYH
jgi:hypothetical protein